MLPGGISYIPSPEDALLKAQSMSENAAFSALISGSFGPKGTPSYDAVDSYLRNLSAARAEAREETTLYRQGG